MISNSHSLVQTSVSGEEFTLAELRGLYRQQTKEIAELHEFNDQLRKESNALKKKVEEISTLFQHCQYALYDSATELADTKKKYIELKKYLPEDKDLEKITAGTRPGGIPAAPAAPAAPPLALSTAPRASLEPAAKTFVEKHFTVRTDFFSNSVSNSKIRLVLESFLNPKERHSFNLVSMVCCPCRGDSELAKYIEFINRATNIFIEHVKNNAVRMVEVQKGKPHYRHDVEYGSNIYYVQLLDDLTYMDVNRSGLRGEENWRLVLNTPLSRFDVLTPFSEDRITNRLKKHFFYSYWCEKRRKSFNRDCRLRVELRIIFSKLILSTVSPSLSETLKHQFRCPPFVYYELVSKNSKDPKKSLEMQSKT